MQEPKNSTPYKNLGAHLKYIREQRAETLAETAGAVEIDMAALEQIEAGRECPAEDILMLLIDHFDMQDQEAVQLWESAGYDRASDPRRRPEALDKAATVVVLAVDTRTQYSDGVVVTAGAHGLTLQFTQDGTAGSPQTIANVGMSYDQAEVVLATLQQAVLRGRSGYTRPRLDPPRQ